MITLNKEELLSIRGGSVWGILGIISGIVFIIGIIDGLVRPLRCNK